MRRLFLALPAVALVALTGCSSAGHPVTAPSASTSTNNSTSPSAQPGTSTSAPAGASLDVNNTAGWYATSPASTLTSVVGSFALSPATSTAHGSIGLQLCDSRTGYAVQLGAVATSSGWKIGYFSGVLSASAGIGGDPCVGNRLLSDGALTSLGTSSTGATLKAQISQQSPGQFIFTYATSSVASFSHRVHATAGQFDEVAAMASYPGVEFQGAIVSQLAAFTGVTTTSTAGVTTGLAGLSPKLVSSSSTGAPPLAVTASSLNPASGNAPSSFDIVGGTPKL